MRFVDLIGVVALSTLCAVGQGTSKPPTPDKPLTVSVCKLLRAPNKYNNRLVKVTALINSDFEHFDMRGDCKGYVRLENSLYDSDVRRFGFQTDQDEEYKRLISLLSERVDGGTIVGANCLECSPKKYKVYGTVTGLFRCHYEFPDCTGISRFGDSSIVIKTVTNARASTSTGGGRQNPWCK